MIEKLRDWLKGLEPNQPLFPKLKNRRTWLMVKLDLERAGIPYTTAEGDADFHAAGRHTHITQLIRSGASLSEAKELARHSDIQMTTRYTHIGLADQAKALAGLPVPCQRIVSSSSVPPVLSGSQSDAVVHANGDSVRDVKPSDSAPSDAAQHAESSDGSDGENWRRRESNPRPELATRQHPTSLVSPFSLLAGLRRSQRCRTVGSEARDPIDPTLPAFSPDDGEYSTRASPPDFRNHRQQTERWKRCYLS